MSTIFITIAMAIVAGIITGFILSLVDCSKNEIYFVDSEHFVENKDIPLPEWEHPRKNDNNLSSSADKLNEREVNIDQEN